MSISWMKASMSPFVSATLADSSLIAVKLAEVSRVMVGSPRIFEKQGTPKSPDELAGHDVIAL